MRLEKAETHGATIGLLSVVVHIGAIFGAVAGGLALQPPADRANPAATINFVRKRPTRQFQASAGVSVGSWGRRRLDADISAPLNADGSVRGRFVAAAQDGDSYIDRYGLRKSLFSGMYHCKVLIVDGLLVSVGSTNFDNRSFRLNDEANLDIYDAAFAAEQTATFERDLAASHPVTLVQWQERPWHQKWVERASSLLAEQL